MKFLLLNIFIFIFAAGLNAQEKDTFYNLSEEDVVGVIHQNGSVLIITEDTLLTFDKREFTDKMMMDSLNFYIHPAHNDVEIDFWIFPFYGVYKDHLRNMHHRNRNKFRAE